MALATAKNMSFEVKRKENTTLVWFEHFGAKKQRLPGSFPEEKKNLWLDLPKVSRLLKAQVGLALPN